VPSTTGDASIMPPVALNMVLAHRNTSNSKLRLRMHQHGQSA
jgi:hypothetical protein